MRRSTLAPNAPAWVTLAPSRRIYALHGAAAIHTAGNQINENREIYIR